MEVAAAGVDIMEVTTGIIRVMEELGVIIMDISPESLVMAMVPMPTEAVAIHAIQG